LSTVQKAKRTALAIALTFLISGSLLLGVSVFFDLQVLAFIGLGFIFWGAIFSVTRKGRFIDSKLLDSSAEASYSTLDRVINDLQFASKAYYIPAYSKNAVIPEYLKKLRSSIVFISDENFTGTPAIDELASGKFLSADSKGVFVTSPGSGLLNQVEQQLNLDFASVPLDELCNLLPRCMTEFFNLSRDMEMRVVADELVQLKIYGIVFESLYKQDAPLKSVSVLGCPVVSAVACALAKSSGKIVAINQQVPFPKGAGVEVLFSFVGSDLK
jgi:hypothetical protein